MCEHTNFKASTRIARLTNTDDGPVVGYSAEVRILCVDCGLPFRFMGLPYGSSVAIPTASADGLELRVPIEPAHVAEILGHAVISGRG